MASRGFTICGSGTVSTRTSCLPCQVSALMHAPDRFEKRVSGARCCGRRLGGRDLAGFHELLEAAQISARLHVRLALEELGNELAECAARRVVENRGGHLRATAARRLAELHASGVLDRCLGRARPAYELVRSLFV